MSLGFADFLSSSLDFAGVYTVGSITSHGVAPERLLMHARLSIEVGEANPMLCTLSVDRVVTLGRNRGNSVVLQDKHASRWHAEIVYEDGHWVLRDCGTLNGTRRNGERLQRALPLLHGDEIGIGDTVLRFIQ
jgi:predicted component of type VI protein secretion system